MVTEARPRRRSEKSRAAIFAATRELALEVGFDKFSIEAVAARAGVGKQTIYRWWPSRPALIADVLLEDFGSLAIAVPDTGDLRADLTRWVRRLTRELTHGNFSASHRILTASAMEDTDTAQRLHTVFSEPLRAAVLGRLKATGGVDEAEAVAAADGILGGVVYPILSEGEKYRVARAEKLVQIIVGGLRNS